MGIYRVNVIYSGGGVFWVYNIILKFDFYINKDVSIVIDKWLL